VLLVERNALPDQLLRVHLAPPSAVARWSRPGNAKGREPWRKILESLAVARALYGVRRYTLGQPPRVASAPATVEPLHLGPMVQPPPAVSSPNRRRARRSWAGAPTPS